MNNTTIPSKQVLITKLKKMINIKKKNLKSAKVIRLENIKAENNKVVFIYSVDVNKNVFQKMEAIEAKTDMLKKSLKHKLQMITKKYEKINKNDPLLILIEKYKYNPEYKYCLKSNKNKCIIIDIPYKEIIK